MKTVDSDDGDIRFTTEWAGEKRYVFIPSDIVAHDAQQSFSREEAITYVREHLGEYADRAQEQHGRDNPEKIVVLKRG